MTEPVKETPTLEERLEEQRAWFHGDGDRTVAKVLSDALSSLREKDAQIEKQAEEILRLNRHVSELQSLYRDTVGRLGRLP